MGLARQTSAMYRLGCYLRYSANGVPPDEGVMVELGMAIALRKPTFLFAMISDGLSIVSSIPESDAVLGATGEAGWQDYFYTAVEEITSLEKALARWAKQPEP